MSGKRLKETVIFNTVFTTYTEQSLVHCLQNIADPDKHVLMHAQTDFSLPEATYHPLDSNL